MVLTEGEVGDLNGELLTLEYLVQGCRPECSERSRERP